MIPLIYVILIWCVIIADIGTILRMLVQFRRDSYKWPGGESWELSTTVELVIGAIIGFIMWLIAVLAGIDLELSVLQAGLYLICASMGYAGADAIEGILKKYEPT